MKKLKVRKIDVAICWNRIKNTPPKDFPNVVEMEKTADLIGVLGKAIPEFSAMIEKGEKIGEDFRAERISEKDIVDTRKAFQKESNGLEEEKGKDIISVEFETAIFDVFFSQFERWGKNWFMKLDDYLAFRSNMKAANEAKEEDKSEGK